MSIWLLPFAISIIIGCAAYTFCWLILELDIRDRMKMAFQIMILTSSFGIAITIINEVLG
jgi:hypothetical protein